MKSRPGKKQAERGNPLRLSTISREIVDSQVYFYLFFPRLSAVLRYKMGTS